MNPNLIARAFLNSILFAVFSIHSAKAQPQWFRGFGGTDSETASGIASDGKGGIYSIGTFSGNTVFGSYNISSNGKGDIYIIKSNASNGNILWIRQIGSTGEDNGYGITCDRAGNLFCTGRFSGNVLFGTQVLTSTGTFDSFIAKLDPSSGLIKWAVKTGGTGFDAGLAISADTSGNVFSCGYFQANGVFGTVTLNAVGQNLNAYLAKVDTSSGNILWAKGFGSSGYTYALSIACDNAGEVYLSGQFDGSVMIGSSTLTAVKYNDAFVAKFNASSGTPLWAISMGGDGEDIGNTIAVGSDNRLYLGGRFEQTLSAAQLTLASKGNADAFVCKIDATNGIPLWLTQFGGGSFEQVSSMVSDASGNIFVTGQYNGICDFGGQMMMASGNADVFLCRLDSSGAVTWNYSMGSSLADIGAGISTDPTNALYCTGSFQQTMKSESQSISSNGSSDVFLIRVDKLTVGTIEEPVTKNILSIFPNPADNTVNVIIKSNSVEEFEVCIFDVSGRKMGFHRFAGGSTHTIDISELEPAVYFLNCTSETGSQTLRFIKE